MDIGLPYDYSHSFSLQRDMYKLYDWCVRLRGHVSPKMHCRGQNNKSLDSLVPFIIVSHWDSFSITGYLNCPQSVDDHDLISPHYHYSNVILTAAVVACHLSYKISASNQQITILSCSHHIFIYFMGYCTILNHDYMLWGSSAGFYSPHQHLNILVDNVNPSEKVYGLKSCFQFCNMISFINSSDL